MYNAGRAKGTPSKVIEPFTKKEWHSVKPPKILKHHNVVRNVINKTTGTKSEGEGRNGHVTDQSLAVPMERWKYANDNAKVPLKGLKCSAGRTMNTERGRRRNTVEEIVHEARRCLYCAHPTCLQCCPTELDVRRMVHPACERDFYEAARIALSANPLALSWGHMCNVDICCEGKNNLSKTHASAIHIRNIQRFSLEQFKQLRIPPTIGAVPKIPHRVAIIGGGPAGVAAATFCARLNFESVDVFEKSARLSGILTEQIQTARLHAEGIAFELGLLQAYPNVHVHFKAPVDADGMRKLSAAYAVRKCAHRRRNTARIDGGTPPMRPMSPSYFAPRHLNTSLLSKFLRLNGAFSTDEFSLLPYKNTVILSPVFAIAIPSFLYTRRPFISFYTLLSLQQINPATSYGPLHSSLSQRKKRFLIPCPFTGWLLSLFPAILSAQAFIFQRLQQAVFGLFHHSTFLPLPSRLPLMNTCNHLSGCLTTRIQLAPTRSIYDHSIARPVECAHWPTTFSLGSFRRDTFPSCRSLSLTHSSPNSLSLFSSSYLPTFLSFSPFCFFVIRFQILNSLFS